MSEIPREMVRWTVTMCLIYAAWYLWKCPCEELLSCDKHQAYFDIAIAVPIVVMGVYQIALYASKGGEE